MTDVRLPCDFLLVLYSMPYSKEEDNIWAKEKWNKGGRGEGIA
jgi:hypothetical protein